MTVIAFLLIIGLLIFAHELGHFITAKAAGVGVLEFAFGFPPRLVSFKRGETTYAINLVPLGGYVRLAGEEDPSEPRSLASKRIPVRLLILSAGAIMNLLLPLVLFSLAFTIPKHVDVGQVVAEEVAADSPAERAGLQPGDTILSIGGRPIENSNDLVYYVHLSLGKETPVELQGADGKVRTVSLVPRWNPPQGQGAMGIMISMENVSTVTRSHPPWVAIPKGFQFCVDTFVLLRNEVATWFIRKEAPQLAGPVGIFQITGEVAQAGFAPLLQFAAFLSINLAIINLLPLPALDGGRIAFVLLEAARRGRRISPQRERLVHLIGFLILITLIVVVSYFDLVRIISGEGVIE